MRPKNHEPTGSGDLFRARLDGEIAPLYSDSGRPGIATQFGPTRIICAMPRAWSVLLIYAFNIARMCGVSTQITGKPASAGTL
jgi:IS5 family transposase